MNNLVTWENIHFLKNLKVITRKKVSHSYPQFAPCLLSHMQVSQLVTHLSWPVCSAVWPRSVSVSGKMEIHGKQNCKYLSYWVGKVYLYLAATLFAFCVWDLWIFLPFPWTLLSHTFPFNWKVRCLGRATLLMPLFGTRGTIEWEKTGRLQNS